MISTGEMLRLKKYLLLRLKVPLSVVVVAAGEDGGDDATEGGADGGAAGGDTGAPGVWCMLLVTTIGTLTTRGFCGLTVGTTWIVGPLAC